MDILSFVRNSPAEAVVILFSGLVAGFLAGVKWNQLNSDKKVDLLKTDRDGLKLDFDAKVNLLTKERDGLKLDFDAKVNFLKTEGDHLKLALDWKKTELEKVKAELDGLKKDFDRVNAVLQGMNVTGDEVGEILPDEDDPSTPPTIPPGPQPPVIVSTVRPVSLTWTDDPKNVIAATSWRGIFLCTTKRALDLGLPLDKLPMKTSPESIGLIDTEVAPGIFISATYNQKNIRRLVSRALKALQKPKGYLRVVLSSGEIVEFPE